ncbi:MAG: hypothetical protein AAFV96_10330 [Pseudomonadota bacterium]
MTRFIDGLDSRPESPRPTPAEVNAIIEEACMLRSRAYGEAFRRLREGTGAMLRAIGETRGPVTLMVDLLSPRGPARG